MLNDITLCPGQGCPDKDNCLRGTTQRDIANWTASYIAPPARNADNKCEMIIPIKVNND